MSWREASIFDLLISLHDLSDVYEGADPVSPAAWCLRHRLPDLGPEVIHTCSSYQTLPHIHLTVSPAILKVKNLLRVSRVAKKRVHQANLAEPVRWQT